MLAPRDRVRTAVLKWDLTSRAMVKSRAALITTSPGLGAESWSRDARRPVRLGLVRSRERRACADQLRTNRAGSSHVTCRLQAGVAVQVGGQASCSRRLASV